MATREWSERHIIELIKKHGGGEGDTLVTVIAPTMNLKGSPTSNVLRDVSVTVWASSPYDPVATYYTVTTAGSANDRPMVASNFKAGQPFVGFMWPRSINRPWSMTSNHTLSVLAGGGTHGGSEYTLGEATFRMRSTSNWGAEMDILNRPHLSGTWGGSWDAYQKFYVLEIMNNGVSALVDNYINEFGRKPRHLTTWHVNDIPPFEMFG